VVRRGELLEKHHTFEDFIDVRRALVGTGDADPARCCAASGASAGGLLIGVMANEAASEFQALVAHVPFVDILTSMLDNGCHWPRRWILDAATLQRIRWHIDTSAVQPL
jgi:protease II